ncbi:MAG: GSCFA domain-containing protein [bacterium]
MNLHTHIPLKETSGTKIDYQSHILLIGSCFAENISEQLAYYKFQEVHNPFGVLFHPVAIENLISNAVHNKMYDHQGFYHNELWSCFDAHSSLNSNSEVLLYEKLNTRLKETYESLKKATHIILTYGTSWVYETKAEGSIVANCHKIPQASFNKRLLSVEDCANSITRSIEHIRTLNDKAEIILTVSPVRHIKDGFKENSQSKAHLIASLNKVMSQFNYLSYFPSYEIMLDELRDYRFYKEDLVHPNTTAITYIFEKFKEVWIENAALPFMKEVAVIQKGLQHKAFNENSQAHKTFISSLEKRIQELQKKLPQISF